MIARSPARLATLVCLVGLALGALAPGAAAQFTVTTPKATFDGREPLFVTEKFVNTSMAPVPYATRMEDGTDSRIRYTIEALDPENRATTRPVFSVERNGGPTLQVRSITFHGVGSGFSGEIGPGRSSTMGGTLGFGVPFNLMLAPPAVTGAFIRLVTEAGQEFVLAPGERIAITSAGSFQLTALVEDILINGYTYSLTHAATGYLVAETVFNVRPPGHRIDHAIR